MELNQPRSPRLERLREKLPVLVFVYFAVQPLLDAVGYWQQRSETENVLTLVLRMLLLGGSILLGFLLSDRKKIYYLTAAVLAAFTALHAAACLLAEEHYTLALSDLVNLLRIYFLPLTALCLMTFLRQNEKVWPALQKALLTDFGLIVLIELLAVLTGTEPHTYHNDGIGVLGWFLWTNSQSAILAMTVPVTICWALRRWEKKLLPVILVTAAAEATLYVLAPRLAYASMAAAGLGVAICLLITDRKRWRQVLAVALVTCLFVAAYPLSPTYQRLNANESRTEQTVKQIQDLDIKIEIVTEPETLPEGETGELPENPGKPQIVIDEQNARKLEKLYRSQDILWSVVERFGRDKVFEAYNYSLDPTVIGNTRLMKIRFCELLMAESGTASHLFGLNLKEMTWRTISTGCTSSPGPWASGS